MCVAWGPALLSRRVCRPRGGPKRRAGCRAWHRGRAVGGGSEMDKLGSRRIGCLQSSRDSLGGGSLDNEEFRSTRSRSSASAGGASRWDSGASRLPVLAEAKNRSTTAGRFRETTATVPVDSPRRRRRTAEAGERSGSLAVQFGVREPVAGGRIYESLAVRRERGPALAPGTDPLLWAPGPVSTRR